jgi:hypothetical protein
MPDISTALRRLIRAKAGSSRAPIKIVLGDSAPVLTGEAGHSEFKGGGVCRNPGGAIRAGYKVYYVRSTLRITVGQGYLDQAHAMLEAKKRFHRKYPRSIRDAVRVLVPEHAQQWESEMEKLL